MAHQLILRIVLSLALVVPALMSATAAADASLFSFVIPWDDAVAETATDVSFLNATPAGSGGFILSKDGHFVEADTGRTVRFFATNMGARGAFPSRDEADRIAARMAKAGINLVRLHHLQNDWEDDDGTIWLPGQPFLDVDPKQIDKLDYLIAALRRNGIYTNMNLTTTRDYIPEVGFPESVHDIPFNHHKKVDIFNRRMIELQRDYAAKLLDRINPYTGLAYRDDPALAFIEINNENSLVGWPGEAPGEGLDTLPEPFLGEITALWNTWLIGRYGSDEALIAAWSAEAGPLGTSLVNADTPWVVETQGGQDTAVYEIQSGPKANTSTGAVLVDVLTSLGAEWLVQAQLKHLTLENDQAYTLQFRARANRERAIGMKIHRDYPDWQDYGLKTSLLLRPEWQDFSFSFKAHSAEPDHGQIAFLLAGEPAIIEIANVSLRTGAVPYAIPAGSSLSRQNLPLAINAGMGRQREDWIRFLVDTERAYVESMRAFLREDLGFHNCMIDTQIEWGGLTSLEREATMEYADAHGYWQHPQFLGSSWDPVNWRVNREALVNRMDSDFGLLGQKAQLRVSGKPFSISEYNHPAPNDYQAEMMPLISSVSCIQDWDAFYTFAYSATGFDEDNTVIQGYFDTGTNPAKVAFYPSTALIYRLGLIPTADSFERLHLPRVPWEYSFTAEGAWTKSCPLPDLRLNRISLTTSNADTARREKRLGNHVTSAATSRNEKGVVWTVDADAAKVIVGFVGDQTVELTGLTLKFSTFGLFDEGFAAITLVDRAGQSLREFDRALLTLVGRVENQEMGWNDERTSVSDQWGHGPMVAEGIPGLIRMEVKHPCIVYALDPTGVRKATVESSYNDGVLLFKVGPAEKTLWYEIARE